MLGQPPPIRKISAGSLTLHGAAGALRAVQCGEDGVGHVPADAALQHHVLGQRAARRRHSGALRVGIEQRGDDGRVAAFRDRDMQREPSILRASRIGKWSILKKRDEAAIWRGSPSSSPSRPPGRP